MSLNVALLRNSFELVVERQPLLTRRFYEILFERFPETRRMFGRNTREAQEQMLTGALVAVLDHLEDASWLAGTLGGLGDKHRGYGVRDEMYGWVGSALLAAIAEAAGEHWTPALEAEWTKAYGAISGMMMAGAQQAVA